MELHEANKLIQELKSLIRKLGSLDTKDGIIQELNDVNSVLESQFSKEKTIVEDLTKLYEKVVKDEKIDLKIKELEINQFEIKEVAEVVDRVESIMTISKSIHDKINQGIVVNVGKIEEEIRKFQTHQKALNQELIKKETDLNEKEKKDTKNIAVEKKKNLKILGAGIFLGGFGLGLTSVFILLCTKLSLQEAWYIAQKLFL